MTIPGDGLLGGGIGGAASLVGERSFLSGGSGSGCGSSSTGGGAVVLGEDSTMKDRHHIIQTDIVLRLEQLYYEFEVFINTSGGIPFLISRGIDGRSVASATSFSGERDTAAVGVTTGEAPGAEAAMEMVLLGRSNT